MAVTLTEAQATAVGKLKNGSVLIGGVGTGKSITALSYFTKRSPDKKIVVITTAKKRTTGEWFEDALKISLRNDMEVDSWNNIGKYVGLKDHSFIFDEQRVVGAGKWSKDFITITKQNDWILLSATPADTWVDLVPIFIAHNFFRNRTEFNTEHVRWARRSSFPKIEGYYDTYILERYRSMIYVDMPVIKATVRELHFLDVPFDEAEQKYIIKKRWDIYKDEPLKDASGLHRILRRSTNSNWARYSAIRSICKNTPKVIIFYNQDYELEILRGLGEDLGIPIAEYNGHKHQPIPETSEWIYLVQMQAGAEGWNCIDTDTVVFYSLPYSNRNFEQAKGRIDRMNTSYQILHYYILRSTSRIDQAIWRSLTKKKNFHASAFGRKIWQDTPSQLLKEIP